ncbi:FG-GAP repeat domain-containing protein [Streptomyces sp. HB2AG]|uniref:FG-GAP repeat domain-containing protein n=1 Tax=Streptomyces sp. HB2AG TaxID=2983400 RepID=UPI0022AADBF9|nr:VCBS repeat-containing protein [Streptomyces sp. HB2AG]MCZ2525671.1 VCBS repeat-containing protein [Streptomyces sp. HB2AG]
MARHVFVRHRAARRAAVAVAASAALAAGLSPLLPTASAEDAPQETVVPATLRSSYTSASLFNPDTSTGTDGAGDQGVFHRLEGYTTPVWTRYADGRTVPAPTTRGTLYTSGTGSDVLAYHYSEGRIDLWDATDGTTRTVRLPEGQSTLGVLGTTVVSYHSVTAEDGTTTRVVHLLTPEPDGTTRDTTVEGLPAGMVLGSPRGAEGTALFFLARLDDTYRMVSVDRETGQVLSWTRELPADYHYAALSADHVVVHNLTDTKVLVLPRADLSAAPAEVVLDGDGSRNPTLGLTVVGDWLVHRPSIGTVVKAKPIAGGASVPLLTSESKVATAPNGTALAIGSTTTDNRGIWRIHRGDDGSPALTQVKPLPKPPRKIQGIALAQGRLVVADTNDGERDDYVRTVAVTGTPEYGERSPFTPSGSLPSTCLPQDVACFQIHGTGDGRITWLARDSGGSDGFYANGPSSGDYFHGSVPAGGQITDVSGRYVIHTTADRQQVSRIDNYAAPTVTRAPGAAAVWGSVLWTADSTPGSVTGLDLTTKEQTETLATGAGCVPEELQALGRWLYWNCGSGGGAGVYDRTTRKSVPVPSGEAKLGDGYVVTHDKQAGKLTLTTVADGTPAGRVIGELPDTGVSQRDVRWTVDEYGANAAYVDDQERVHLVPSGVPTQPLSLLAPADKTARIEPVTFDSVPKTLTTLRLSKPSAKWRLTVQDRATGKVVDTATGGAARGKLVVGWDGSDYSAPGEGFLPNGAYDWTLSVTPADGTGDPLEARGTVALRAGSPVRRDHTSPDFEPDGTSDLLTLNSSGELAFHHGNGKGAFSGKTSASGWSTSVVAVPFGDLNNDRCNDVLVRMADGSLRSYKPKCGHPPTTSTRYMFLGTGWSAYNVLTSPGDMTGDGRADLLARKSSTGDIFLFAAKSDGTLAAGQRIRSGWTSYTKIVGAGDLNGDGHGDVLARHKDGTLYRYDGLGTGKLKDRVKVFSGWGGTYTAIVGTGDITGDGKADLVVRDSSGNLYRNNGKGDGTFTARTKIATGWTYKGVF